MSSSSSNMAPGQDTTPSPAPAMHPALSALTYAERIAIRLDNYRKTLADRPFYMEPAPIFCSSSNITRMAAKSLPQARLVGSWTESLYPQMR